MVILAFILIFTVFYIAVVIDWDKIYSNKIHKDYNKWHKKFKEMLIDLEKNSWKL